MDDIQKLKPGNVMNYYKKANKKMYFRSNMAILDSTSRGEISEVCRCDLVKDSQRDQPHIISFNASDSLTEACFKQWKCHEIGARFF